MRRTTEHGKLGKRRPGIEIVKTQEKKVQRKPKMCHWMKDPGNEVVVSPVIRDFKIRDHRRLDARSSISGGLDRVRSFVACCGA